MAVFAITACKKSGTPTPKPTAIPTIDPNVDVYVVGTSKGPNGDIATYWKNGTSTLLGNNAFYSLASTIAVQGSDVYVAGCAGGSSAQYAATLWKNGAAIIPNISANSATNLPNSTISTIVLNGADLYMAGFIDLYAISWKNGSKLPFQALGSNSGANGIAINGNDVYVAGYLGVNNTYSVATYWKNGIATLLTPSNSVAVAEAVAVAGTDVYVVGYTLGADNKPIATYWKNGVAKVLGGASSEALNVAVNGTDVYISGYISSGAVYWENDVVTNLLSNPGTYIVSPVVFKGNDIYVAGYNANGPIYWKNGVAVQLPQIDNVSYVSSVAIFVH